MMVNVFPGVVDEPAAGRAVEMGYPAGLSRDNRKANLSIPYSGVAESLPKGFQSKIRIDRR